MKTLIVVLLLSQSAWCCSKGYYEYNGDCQYEAPDAEPQKPVVPDDVKPPRGVQPAWETGSVKVVPAVVATDSDTVKVVPNGGVPKR